jgi:DNA-binding protein H-NS
LPRGITPERGFDVATLHELMAQKDAIERQIEQTKKQERGDAVAKVHALMSEYGLTLSDLGAKASGKTKSGATTGKVAAKYRNISTGDSWSGRGLQPRWLKAALASGKKLADFAV